MTKAEKEKEALDRIMKGLKCSEEEAKAIYEYDCEVEKSSKAEFDLDADKAKIAQKFAHTGTRKKPTVYQFKQREHKPNVTKGGLIAELAKFLEENSEFDIQNLDIVNKERMITFTIGGDSFELTLIQKRKKK